MYPAALRAEIDATNDWVYPGINDGVYKCGFAKLQAAYDEAVTALFESLDRVEEILSKQRYQDAASVYKDFRHTGDFARFLGDEGLDDETGRS